LDWETIELSLRTKFQFAVAAGLLAALAPLARGGERVTLRNGFAMQCDHLAQVEGHVRLYLSAGETSYIELQPAEVMSVEQLPDRPAQPAAIAPRPANSDAKLSPPDLHEILVEAGRVHNLDVDLLASVVKAESDGNVRAISRAGARGLMQLMPPTASDMGVEDSFEPTENVRGGSTYLDSLLARYHENLALALAAYNAGPAAVDKYRGIPPYRETRAYVAHVIHEFNRRVLAREQQARRSGDAAVASQTPASR
jgi:soluble lytic murein transglycosylase-like protein